METLLDIAGILFVAVLSYFCGRSRERGDTLEAIEHLTRMAEPRSNENGDTEESVTMIEVFDAFGIKE